MIGITEIMREVVKATSRKCGVPISYVFGNSEYIKEQLDTYSHDGSIAKLPLIALFCPIVEQRGADSYVSTCSVNMVIACSTLRELTNEQREEASFKNILRPIYENLLLSLKEDKRFYFGYKPKVKHKYSENYSYGRYGAYTAGNDQISEPIDAIDIREMEIRINDLNDCRK